MMRNILMAAALITTGYVSAQVPVNQSALAPTKISSVKQALSFKDDTPVKLKGQVVKSLGDEKYQFRDSTGTITIDVDDELWQGRAISPTTTVTLIGEVDIDHKPLKRVEIDVDAVEF
ncbi:NirD/YgiW/YdeI family stress tolerance protein [Acinetobacter sp. S40]|uniref:NirD/YgiW/YdeI family stress tolerance protein n=1 Tax=unclassified Acinetobacter TaxID=196816 RepID=UPI00190C4F0C|nr:NirD/YgiW/YdeI family stress tolerance protein [Acinetobacter sp. S40]MBK0063186.1 NirD/YgiW/YdeI family stress tolerance protein [Acinetobacter sp. S55]MBK0066396.1 NirD/YgiW/YdeI family stress tolerance protein [Acinetobacter sp. S54]